MTMKVRSIHPEFAAEIGGIELGRFVDHAVVDTIWEAIDRYAVLVFHDQHLDDEGLRNFADNFGELEIGRAAARVSHRPATRADNRAQSELRAPSRCSVEPDRLTRPTGTAHPQMKGWARVSGKLPLAITDRRSFD